MDLKTIQGELQQLSELVEGWVQADDVPALERDLALEKLRSVYDKVRFGASEPAAETPSGEEDTAVAEVIDLGDVLSLDPFAGEEEPESVPEPEPAEPAAEEAIPESGPGPVMDPEPVAEPEPVMEPEPVVESVAESEAEPEPEPEFVAGPAPAGPEPVAEPAGEFVPEPFSAEPEPEPELEQQPQSDPQPVAAAEPASEPEEESEKSHYVAPTLFGLEEETIRHRNKQRVIMSLYDPAVETPARPEPAPKPAPAPAEVPAPAPVVETPAPEVAAPVPAEVSAPEPEIATGKPAAVPEVSAAAPEFRKPVFGTVPEPEEEDEPGFEEITLEPAAPAGTVLGDIINHDVQTLADTLAAPRDRASELRRSEPVTDLRRAIGINDKFLLIRDLFGGDGEAYEKAIGVLNDCADFDDCMIYIAENYAWNPNSDGVKLLMDLLERKFA
ncbi:MAG: hypothetical protein IJ850_01000 [Alistipes sp.]|uniref:hypothetical protein n=1 Tax=Alistipes TaxID=239759 RepID=UPI00101D441B|nr:MULTISPECIES: hypothetical protein [Alistipes]MBR2216900.1 hypothetical protein [Alistipes sp.]